MQATGNLKLAQDFFGYSEAALAQGLLAESQKVLDTGLKANVFPAGPDRDRAARYLKSAASRADAQKAELPKLEAEAKASATGDKYVNLADSVTVSGSTTRPPMH